MGSLLSPKQSSRCLLARQHALAPAVFLRHAWPPEWERKIKLGMFSLKVCWPLLSFMLAVNQTWVVGGSGMALKLSVLPSNSVNHNICEEKCKSYAIRQADKGDVSLRRIEEGTGRMPNLTSSVPCNEPFSSYHNKSFPWLPNEIHCCCLHFVFSLGKYCFFSREIKEAKTLHKALDYLTKPGKCSWDRWPW